MDKSTPLVSIICLCYNQNDFVVEALNSVFNQTYSNFEVIIIDDCSQDISDDVIEGFLASKPLNNFTYTRLPKNVGNCKAFNLGLSQAKGKYIIDFSADDVMQLNKLKKQVLFFDSQTENVGMTYSNTKYINSNSDTLNSHFDDNGNFTAHQGNVYEKAISEYFIPTTTMMFRKDVLERLGGYDESLSYEDFDIWVRIARDYDVAYQHEVLMRTRLSSGSMSRGWYQSGDPQAMSTYQVCRKISTLNKTSSENEALVIRLKYELRQCFRNKLKKEFELNYALMQEISKAPLLYIIMKIFI